MPKYILGVDYKGHLENEHVITAEDPEQAKENYKKHTSSRSTRDCSVAKFLTKSLKD